MIKISRCYYKFSEGHICKIVNFADEIMDSAGSMLYHGSSSQMDDD